MDYTFSDHLHNYSVWTAARAVQRNFTTSKNIKESIEESDPRERINSKELWDVDSFDLFHRECCNQIIGTFNKMDISCSYGRAAKIIAIYIKTSVIIRNSGKGSLSEIAHPPIDSILLKNLDKEYKDLKLSENKWTQLTEIKYFAIIGMLRSLDFKFFWEIERYWNPVQE